MLQTLSLNIFPNVVKSLPAIITIDQLSDPMMIYERKLSHFLLHAVDQAGIQGSSFVNFYDDRLMGAQKSPFIGHAEGILRNFLADLIAAFEKTLHALIITYFHKYLTH